MRGGRALGGGKGEKENESEEAEVRGRRQDERFKCGERSQAQRKVCTWWSPQEPSVDPSSAPANSQGPSQQTVA